MYLDNSQYSEFFKFPIKNKQTNKFIKLLTNFRLILVGTYTDQKLGKDQQKL